jgi:hypothetical protein
LTLFFLGFGLALGFFGLALDLIALSFTNVGRNWLGDVTAVAVAD